MNTSWLSARLCALGKVVYLLGIKWHLMSPWEGCIGLYGDEFAFILNCLTQLIKTSDGHNSRFIPGSDGCMGFYTSGYIGLLPFCFPALSIKKKKKNWTWTLDTCIFLDNLYVVNHIISRFKRWHYNKLMYIFFSYPSRPLCTPWRHTPCPLFPRPCTDAIM